MKPETSGPPVLSVSELVGHLKGLVEGDPLLRRVWVVGELSGVKHHSSGHWYFTLKDEAQIRAVMFRREAASLSFVPTDGQAVLALGRVGVYERDGQTQLYVQHLEPAGVGQYYRDLEALKARLQAEGLFTRPKRRLPYLPRAVGVVTSRVGAALEDIRTVAHRRYPGMRLIVAPVLVQGTGAADSIVEGLSRIVTRPDVDVVILARGGGSREDLAAFNDERVVRAVARVPVPVISAVGHEVDVSLADLAADVRAPTPSAAAELAVPERAQLLAQVTELMARVTRHLQARIGQERWRMRALAGRAGLTAPDAVLSGRRLGVARNRDLLDARFRQRLETWRKRLVKQQAQLEALNPIAVMERGWSLVTDPSGRLVRAQDVAAGDVLTVEWLDGAWETRAERPLTRAQSGGAKGETERGGRSGGTRTV
jgi:exodeoxyribonuclease VII large subunit